MFPTPRLQLSGGGFQKSFRELFDILTRWLIGKSDSEARTKEEKEELGGARGRREREERGALVGAGPGVGGRDSPQGDCQSHAAPCQALSEKAFI